jgi:Extensin-like protein C-terminus
MSVIAFFIAAGSLASADTIPLPPERPEILPGERTSPPESDITPSPCQLRLAKLAIFSPSPSITGPGQCMATDVVTVEAVILIDKHRVAFSPSVRLRCPMAEAVARWVAADVAPAIADLGTSLQSIEALGSFECRPRNSIPGEQISEHGRANALDVRSLRLANGAVIELTSASVAKPLRRRLRDSACERFSTVLGNGADAYHDTHVHVDLMERANHYKICQWDVLDPAETAALEAKKAAATATRISAAMREGSDVPLPRRPLINTDAANLWRHSVPRISQEGATRTPVVLSLALSLGTPVLTYAEEQTVTVGPWAIATSYKGDNFDGCSMSRSTGELGITFVRAQDSLLLLLESQKWKLERGKAYSVRLVAGGRAVEAKALAESKVVTIVLVDGALKERLRTADVLEVRGEGATLRVPLDGSTAALGRLETCFDKNSRAGVDTNPFVSPSHKP